MLRAHRRIFARSLTALLAVVMVAFPAAASAGLVAHCATAHAEVAGDCCATHEDGGSRREDSDSSTPADCPKCMHACCRATADVARGPVAVVPDRDVIAPILLPAESAHDPVTCDAIFHPPRN